MPYYQKKKKREKSCTILALNNINLLFYSSRGQSSIIKSQWAKINLSAGSCSFRSLKSRIYYLPFPASNNVIHILCLVALSIFKARNGIVWTPASMVISPSLIVTFLLFCKYKGSCNYIEPYQINQDYLPISKSLI